MHVTCGVLNDIRFDCEISCVCAEGMWLKCMICLYVCTRVVQLHSRTKGILTMSCIVTDCDCAKTSSHLCFVSFHPHCWGFNWPEAQNFHTQLSCLQISKHEKTSTNLLAWVWLSVTLQNSWRESIALRIIWPRRHCALGVINPFSFWVICLHMNGSSGLCLRHGESLFRFFFSSCSLYHPARLLCASHIWICVLFCFQNTFLVVPIWFSRPPTFAWLPAASARFRWLWWEILGSIRVATHTSSTSITISHGRGQPMFHLILGAGYMENFTLDFHCLIHDVVKSAVGL